MDVELFLTLPIDIRREVYFHLDGNFSRVSPVLINHLYSDQTIKLASTVEADNARQKLLKRKLYGVFSDYLNIFDYSPSLIEQWLEYSIWLRYDSIVLDCLRLNHSYGGSLIGQIDWIYLDGRLRLAYFKNCMLVVWYTLAEYARWIIREEEEEEEEISFFRLNIEHLNLNSLKRILKSFGSNDLYLLLSEVFLEHDEETDSSVAADDDPDLTTYPINDPMVIEVLGRMELMKNLNKVSVRGPRLFEALINFHGVRDNPGKTISYMVKRRIMRLELHQLDDPAQSGLADFTRWENLRELRFVNLSMIDLNKLSLPSACRIVILEEITSLTWWKLEDKIDPIIEGSAVIKKLNATTRIKTPDSKLIKPEDLGRCQSLVWQAFKHLNFLKLQNVTAISGGRIVVPCALYNSGRVLLFPTTSSVKEIIII